MSGKEVWFEYHEATPDGLVVFTARSIPVHSIRQARNILDEVKDYKPHTSRLCWLKNHEIQHLAETIGPHGEHYFGGQFLVGQSLQYGPLLAYQLPDNIPPQAGFRSMMAPGRSDRQNLSSQDIRQGFIFYLQSRQSFNGGFPKKRT